uniref:Uncharacterized protein n=1 Tax=Romanomermis culicivorax TaxID=13658 RepID=A0A915IGU2_ROMCU
MTNAIARWHQQATDVGSSGESAYANYYRGLSEEYFRKNIELNNELTTTQELVEKYKQEVQKVENKLVNAYTSARLCNTYLKECKKQAQLIMSEFRRNNFDVRVAEQSLTRICALCDQTLLKFAEGGLI